MAQKYNISKGIRTLLYAMFLLCYLSASASHLVGGEISYQYLGDTSDLGISKYSITLTIYEDCLNGSELAIAQDTPAFLGIYYNDDTKTSDRLFFLDTNMHCTTSESVPLNFSNSCVSNLPVTCLLKKTFTKTYYLPHSSTGYVIDYQRCCRNSAINNVFDPGNTGSTFYTTIPAWPQTNNSAAFKNFPPQVICLDNPLVYDNSATDADGDSLSYNFCVSLSCCDGPSANVKPYPIAPTELPNLYFDSIAYNPGYTSIVPMNGFPEITINATTGMITGTPNLEMRYLVTVCCDEWRKGVLINVDRREFQFVVTPCTKKVIADIPQFSTDPNTYIVDCHNYTVNFVNTSSGGFSYLWTFGVPGLTNDTSDAFEPTFTYPDTGTFTVHLMVNPGSTCPDSISRLVKVYPTFTADFSDSGDFCAGDTIAFKDLTQSSLKPINYWKWNFGDGDSSFTENPIHQYDIGGTYNVSLISENTKDCLDTALKQVLIEKLFPFAGNDTIIIKGSTVYFDATGGILYSWSPGTYLSDTDTYNPVGNFPDTGTFRYVLYVKSAFGCSGYDTMSVQVVNQSEFFVPTAFSPNGDNLNDFFKPIAVGYKNLNYFFVFNRWGQRVYNGTSFETGWDGTFNGEKCDIGTYFWELGYTDRFGKKGSMKGDVTLIR